MADDRSTPEAQQVEAGADEPALVEEELVDEISIDGMCGVY
jgi:mycofactocin precursor